MWEQLRVPINFNFGLRGSGFHQSEHHSGQSTPRDVVAKFLVPFPRLNSGPPSQILGVNSRRARSADQSLVVIPVRHSLDLGIAQITVQRGGSPVSPTAPACLQGCWRPRRWSVRRACPPPTAPPLGPWSTPATGSGSCTLRICRTHNRPKHMGTTGCASQ